MGIHLPYSQLMVSIWNNFPEVPLDEKGVSFHESWIADGMLDCISGKLVLIERLVLYILDFRTSKRRKQ